ncbi:AAA family ATPase [Stenotrophomonas sp. 169]|uniref:ATP-dependent nuclease n=1 Tax=Stenotrophomonas sp. 169 TaxID=2770322 RepID=UPI0016622C8F|nr:ATP-binding protein [Stenotrophomonas sp. 169]QNR96019.1 AAA family ATPase [Stenotrophomonas sp. 169]
MDLEAEIATLVKVVGGFKPGKPLEGFITHIRFPQFKSLESNATVKFDFPFTALVGPNGVGKTSVLHALYGAPFGQSTAQFWFATDLDPIAGTRTNPQRFIYGHWNASFNGVVETRKARLGKARDYDYWEPYRSSKADGMSDMPKGKYDGMSKDRWNPVRRDVVYINLKMSFGSFDRYFYMDQGGSLGDRRAVMLREAKRLKRIKDTGATSYSLGGRERVFGNRLLTKSELDAVCLILGRKYDSARVIEHSLYPKNRGKDMTVVFNRGFEYSEAFAGTGEVSAVSVVMKVVGAKPNSLILLDEPETSLHPGAQRALLKFLLDQIKIHKHQIVVSTHSADLLEGLPDSAICVFEDNGEGKARVINGCSPLVALHRIGRAPAGKIRVLVEDPMAQMLVEKAIESLDDGERAIVEVRVAPGGAEAMFVHHGPGAMLTGDDVYLLLDGDKRKVDCFSDPAGIAPARYSTLPALLEKELGAKPKFLLAGGNDEDGRARAEIAAHLNYLTWIGERLRYLPKLCPEQIIIDGFPAWKCAVPKTSEDSKKILAEALACGVEVTSQDVLVLAKVAIGQLAKDNPDLATIRAYLAAWIQGRRR